MSKRLPLRIFHSLPEIQFQWQTSQSEVRQWLMQGDLVAHVWLPLLSYYEIAEEVEDNRVIQTRTLCHRDGYFPLYPHACRNLLRSGQVHIRDFPSSDPARRYLLHETLESVTIQISDLVILEEERLRFERHHNFRKQLIQQSGKQGPSDLTFKVVYHQGRDHRFGEIQAAILRTLFEASQKGSPWMNGKQLLAKVASQSYTLANVFKRRPIWRQLIDSDERGSYRMNEHFIASLQRLE